MEVFQVEYSLQMSEVLKEATAFGTRVIVEAFEEGGSANSGTLCSRWNCTEK